TQSCFRRADRSLLTGRVFARQIGGKSTVHPIRGDELRALRRAQIVLQRACVMTVIGKLKPTSVPGHMSMYREAKPLRPSPRRFTIRFRASAVIGPPRSVVNMSSLIKSPDASGDWVGGSASSFGHT